MNMNEQIQKRMGRIERTRTNKEISKLAKHIRKKKLQHLLNVVNQKFTYSEYKTKGNKTNFSTMHVSTEN